MTRAVQKLAWCCDSCGAPYTHEDQAQRCCTCPSCGGPSPRIRSSVECKKCRLEDSISYNTRLLEDVAKALTDQKAELERMKIRVVVPISGPIKRSRK